MPDIVLLDNKLPGIEGIEVLEYIKNQHYDILVVMITSYASLELAVKATRDGAYDFIPKPFTPQELRGSLENITKQLFLKRMTQKLNKEGKQIRFQFLSVLSHELKAPLNALEGYVRMIQERQLGEDITAYDDVLERLTARINGMRTLILDLLDFTKIETGKPTQRNQQVDLKHVARTSMDTVRPYAIQKDVKVLLCVPEDIVIEADAGEMEIIFNNLLSNAVKYNKDGGRVDVSIRQDENRVEIKVADTGIGMEADEAARLFKDFVRIKNPKTRNITGSGLGLSIVKKIIDLYDGEIKVESQPDAGSTFTVLLPKRK